MGRDPDEGHYGTALGSKPPRDRKGRFRRIVQGRVVYPLNTGVTFEELGAELDRRAEVKAAVRDRSND